MKRIVVLDYGSGNLRSAQRALARIGAEVTVTADLEAARTADGLVVPGVGAFSACMDGLLAVGADRLVDARLAGNRAVLGICVGMQAMFELGVEHGQERAGLGQWMGTVERLTAPILPHMGWNTVTAPASSQLFAGVPTGERFYFVHSYAATRWAKVSAVGPEAVVSWTDYGKPFVAAVEHGPLWATQFHPEKSGDAGAQLLENWLAQL